LAFFVLGPQHQALAASASRNVRERARGSINFLKGCIVAKAVAAQLQRSRVCQHDSTTNQPFPGWARSTRHRTLLQTENSGEGNLSRQQLRLRFLKRKPEDSNPETTALPLICSGPEFVGITAPPSIGLLRTGPTAPGTGRFSKRVTVEQEPCDVSRLCVKQSLRCRAKSDTAATQLQRFKAFSG
jgi:hypothetical protein